MTRLMAIADRHRLAVVEDACQAHLATCGGRPVGTIGVAGAFSFYPTKNLGAMGDGGAVITNDAAMAARIKRLRNGGQTSRYHHLEPGANSRLDEMQAAILRARLPFLQAWTDHRRALARCYRQALDGAAVITPSERDPGHVYHLFPIRTHARAELQEHLKTAGIETLVHYPVPIPRQPALQGMSPDQCPIADRVCNELLSLPMYPALTEADATAIGDAVRSFQAPLAPEAPQAP
jgi:dTDP-4-amino-4,6-dideoxygalactose transaminase